MMDGYMLGPYQIQNLTTEGLIFSIYLLVNISNICIPFGET